MARYMGGLSGTVAASLLTGATIVTGLTGCATGDGSGSAPAQVASQNAISDIMYAVKAIGPGVASVQSDVANPVQAAIENGISSNSNRNNRFISFLYFNADGTWRKDSIHALGGEYQQGYPIMNYQPTQRELLQYIAQQRGTEAYLMEDGQGGLLQGFKDMDTVLVRNMKVLPQQAWMMRISGFDGNVLSVRPASTQEILESQTRPPYRRIIAPHNITPVHNYNPWNYVQRQQQLHRANVVAGNPYPLPSSYQDSPVNLQDAPPQVQPQPAATQQQPSAAQPPKQPAPAPAAQGQGGVQFNKKALTGKTGGR